MTIDELIIATLEGDQELIALGVVPGSVYQPDTAVSPEERPFTVLRWGSTQQRIGSMYQRPVSFWVYDLPGDLSRTRLIVERIGKLLPQLDPTRLDHGFLHSFSEGPQSQDSYDDGFKSAVIAKEMMAVLESG